MPASVDAALFGPSTYEECVLENLKNAKTNDAVVTVHAMCKAKFQKEKSSKDAGIKICKLYWNGWDLVLGDKSNDKNKFILWYNHTNLKLTR